MELFIPDIGVVASILFALAIASFYDLCFGTIPIVVFPLLLVGVLPVSFLVGGPPLHDSILGALTAFAAFFVMAWQFKGGGGDVIMMTVLGWCLGLRGISALTIITSGLYLLFIITAGIVHKAKGQQVKLLYRQYPYAPFVTAGFLAYLVIAWHF